jgi:hypothetical protein
LLKISLSPSQKLNTRLSLVSELERANLDKIIKNLADLSGQIQSIIDTQNLLFNKLKSLETQITERIEPQLAELVKFQRTQNQQVQLEKLTSQISSLNIGKTVSQTTPIGKPSYKVILAKPRK